MNKESKLIELFKKILRVQQPTKTLRKMKLKITTLIIIEGNQVENIYHSLEDNQDKAYQDLINQVNATYGDGGILQFKTIKGIKNYFDSVTIETQELIPMGFKNTLLNRETK